jgi:DNA-binding NtrC family response regulator
MNKQDFRILVADDDEIVREVITTLLAQQGYAVIPAADGVEALNRLRSAEFHLIITDLKMPGVDGIEVLKHASRMNPDITVVILTAYGTLDTTLEAMQEGAYDYLTKPFKTQEIIILAERVWRRAQLIADNRELRKVLRDTYRDPELVRLISADAAPEATMSWVARLDRLLALNVLAPEEKILLTERLIKPNG